MKRPVQLSPEAVRALTFALIANKRRYQSKIQKCEKRCERPTASSRTITQESQRIQFYLREIEELDAAAEELWQQTGGRPLTPHP